MQIVGQRLRYHPSGYSGTQYAGGSAVNGVAASWFSQVLPIRNNGINYSVASGYKDWTTSLGGGDGQHALIQSLNTQWIMQNAFSWLFGTGSFTGARHVYGWAPSAGYSGGHADMPVYPHAGRPGRGRHRQRRGRHRHRQPRLGHADLRPRADPRSTTSCTPTPPTAAAHPMATPISRTPARASRSSASTRSPARSTTPPTPTI